MQTYSVKRENNKVYILDVINDVSDLNISKFITIEDDDINQIIMSNMDNKSVILNDGKIEFEDEKYYDISIKDFKRVDLIKKAKIKMESLVQSVDMITYINYIDINNELMDLGYVITSDNREEQFIKILETEDEGLINKLEQFLTIKDELGPIKSARREFSELVYKVKQLKETDVDELSRLDKTI